MKKKDDPSINEYPTATYPKLEERVLKGCPCCGEPFTEHSRMDFAARCHPQGNTLVSYWDGYLYVTCMECRQPIVRIPVDKSLLPLA